MTRITPTRHRDKMTRKIIEIIVFLKAHTTTRTLRQSISTSSAENPSATDREASDNQHPPHISREYPPASSSPHQPSNPERNRPFLQYVQSLRDKKHSSCPFQS